MIWTKLKKRIRRFLRDPSGNIWDDTILKRLFNDEQASMCNKSGLLESIAVLRLPPFYHDSYLYDWEWRHIDHSGKNYQALRFQQQSEIVFCHVWESQQLGIGTGSESDYGEHYTHPFEAWYCPSANGDPVSIWFPEDFRKAKLVCWDRDPIEASTEKLISSQDPSWKTRTGTPQNYFRRDSLSNEFYLYPHVSDPSDDDIEGDKLEGGILFDDSNTESAEGQTVMDITSQAMNQDDGIATDNLDLDNNLLIIYEAESTDIESEDDAGVVPGFLQKYVEYATLERAYSMNTDGHIESLRDYWGWRKNLGMEIIRAYKTKRTGDRDYQLVTKGLSGRRSRRHPRLPDTYPAMP